MFFSSSVMMSTTKKYDANLNTGGDNIDSRLDGELINKAVQRASSIDAFPPVEPMVHSSLSPRPEEVFVSDSVDRSCVPLFEGLSPSLSDMPHISKNEYVSNRERGVGSIDAVVLMESQQQQNLQDQHQDNVDLEDSIDLDHFDIEALQTMLDGIDHHSNTKHIDDAKQQPLLAPTQQQQEGGGGKQQEEEQQQPALNDSWGGKLYMLPQGMARQLVLAGGGLIEGIMDDACVDEERKQHQEQQQEPLAQHASEEKQQWHCVQSLPAVVEQTAARSQFPTHEGGAKKGQREEEGVENHRHLPHHPMSTAIPSSACSTSSSPPALLSSAAARSRFPVVMVATKGQRGVENRPPRPNTPASSSVSPTPLTSFTCSSSSSAKKSKLECIFPGCNRSFPDIYKLNIHKKSKHGVVGRMLGVPTQSQQHSHSSPQGTIWMSSSRGHPAVATSNIRNNQKETKQQFSRLRC